MPQRFEFPSGQYIQIYKALKKAFTAKEWPKSGPKPGGKYGIWNKPSVSHPSAVQRDFSVNYKFFYERFGWAKRGENVSLSEDLAITVFKYIGCNGHDFAALKDDFFQRPELYEEKKDAKNEEPTNGELETLKRQFDEVGALVLKFYNGLSAGDYRAAWDTLSPRLKNSICKSDFDRFCEGFSNTKGIRNTKVFNLEESAPSVIDCSVYYEDEITSYRSRELSSLDLYTVSDIEDFVANIRKFQGRIVAAGGTNFESIELYKLFEPAASEYIWYKCSLEPDQLDLVFSTSRTLIIKRLYFVTCKKLEGQWKIDGIRELKTYSSR